MSRSLLYGPWLLSTILGLTLASRSIGQAPRPRGFEATGTDYFRHLLQMRGFKALQQRHIDDPAKSILIIFGDLNEVDRISGGLVLFLDEGGAVLLASDRQPTSTSASDAIRKTAGVQVTGTKYTSLLQDTGLVRCYRDKDFCPFLRALPNASPDLLGGSGLLAPLGLQVATNLPSSLKVVQELPEGISKLASLPLGCMPADDTLNPLARILGGLPRPFAVGGEILNGRILVLADHSIFINEMMAPSDNDNFMFANNCLGWLSGAANERTQVLFIDDGKIRTTFDVPLRTIQIDVNQVLAQIGHRLAEMGPENAYNQALLNRIPIHRIYQLVLIGLSLLLAVYLIFRMGVRARYRLPPALPRLERVLRQHTPERALLDQRELAMLATGNLGQAARAIARDCFSALGFAPPDEGEPAGRAPRVLNADFGTKLHWTWTVRRLWRMAMAPAPARFTARACRRLARDVEELQLAIDQGRLRLIGNPS